MENNYIFVPVIVQEALTLWLYIYLGIAKSQAVKLGEVNEDRRALRDDAWPDRVLQINNYIRNQFQVPVLFYVLVGILWGIGGINIYMPLRRKLFMAGRFIKLIVP